LIRETIREREVSEYTCTFTPERVNLQKQGGGVVK
jgi:hypothetical protein